MDGHHQGQQHSTNQLALGRIATVRPNVRGLPRFYSSSASTCVAAGLAAAPFIKPKSSYPT